MKPRISLSLPVVFLFGSALLVVIGCKSKEPPAKPTATLENLKVAHACAFKRSLWYNAAATEADNERLGNLASLFRAISRSEQIHAQLHEQLLQSKGEATDTSKAACLPLGTARQALKMAISLERMEVEGLYPAMAHAADQEQWPDAAQQFRNVREADADHGVMIKEAFDRSGTLPMQSYSVCISCGKVLLRGETICPICKGTTIEKL